MALTGPTRVAVATVIEEPAHAKHVSDGLASEIGNNIKELLASGYAVEAGHREHVLLLAQIYPRPTVDAGNKTGMRSTSRCIVAHYPDEVLSVSALRDFKAMPGAKKNRFHVGLNEDPARCKDGEHTVRPAFCACSSCCAPNFDFKECQFVHLVGRSTRGCPRQRL